MDGGFAIIEAARLLVVLLGSIGAITGALELLRNRPRASTSHSWKVLTPPGQKLLPTPMSMPWLSHNEATVVNRCGI